MYEPSVQADRQLRDDFSNAVPRIKFIGKSRLTVLHVGGQLSPVRTFLLQINHNRSKIV